MIGSIDALAKAYAQDPEAELSLPCPVRVPLERAWEDALDRGVVMPLRLRLEGHANKGEAAERDLARSNPEDLPWLLATPGVGWLYGKEARERLMDSGAFQDVSGWARGVGPLSGLRDPQGRITVLCANLTVLAVDDRLAQGRKPLHAWSDLLDPSWERGLVLRGNGTTFCETTLLTLEHHLGWGAMDKIRRAVGGFGHPSQMVKALSRPGPGTLPAATLPLFFARLLPRREGLRIVWPTEGAIASPVSLFVKKDAPEHVASLARWLCGREVADLCTGVGLPSASPDLPWSVPEGSNVLSIGWDAIRSQDLSKKLEGIQVLFEGAGS